MFIWVTRKKIKSSLLHCGKRGILYQFHIIYITLKYYFEGKVDLTYSDFSFMIGTNFVTNYLFSLKKNLYYILLYSFVITSLCIYIVCKIMSLSLLTLNSHG